MRYTPDEYKEVRPTSGRRRWLIALVPMADMLLELAVWSAGCLFLVMSESTEDLIVNSVSMHMPILGWTTGVSRTPSGCVGEAGLYSHMHMR